MNSPDVARIPKRWIPAARVAWVLLSSTLLIAFFAGFPIRYSELSQTCSDSSCFIMLLHPTEADILLNRGLSLHNYAVFHLVVESINSVLWLGFAVFVFWKKFTHIAGLLLAFILVCSGLFLLSLISQSSVMFYTGQANFRNLLSIILCIPTFFFFFMFPNGRFVPKWSKFIPWLVILALLLSIAMSSAKAEVLNLIFTCMLLLWALTGAFSQIYRYRFIATPLEKRQIKWAFYGMMTIAFVVFNWAILFEAFSPAPSVFRFFLYTGYFLIHYMLLLFVPVSFVIAVMRYRFWDIDVLIRRTLIYGLLSASLAILYFGMIITSQNMFRSLTGQDSQLVIVLSTLAISALFTPLRRVIQNLIDRRFYRQKYDAENVLAEFALKARNEVELNSLTKELTEVIKKTMQPTHLALWIKDENIS